MAPKKGFLEKLKSGERILCAEGYLYEFERRGYLQSGGYVPEVVLEHPDLVRQLHEEFVHAGSDVVQAFTYYAHREKLRIINREGDLEKINRKALEIAKQVADDTGTLMAGNICNTTRYDPKDPKTHEEVRAMFNESVGWAKEAGADFVIGETYIDYGEAALALEVIKQYDLPAVIMMAQPTLDKLRDGVTYAEACRRLEENGAAVVGLNCFSGPETMIQMMKPIKEVCKGPLACLPVPYRTTPSQHTMLSLTIPETGERAFPTNLDRFYCSSDDIAKFGKDCNDLDIQYVGICCGNSSRFFRRLAETLGRTPPASRYSPDISRHFIFGDKKQHSLLRSTNVEILRHQIETS